MTFSEKRRQFCLRILRKNHFWHYRSHSLFDLRKRYFLAFREIENSLLLALKESAFKESISLEEEYDRNLLFGKEGWIDA